MFQKWRKHIIDILCLFLGTFVYAAGINAFIVPNYLTSGGVTGIATQIGFLFDIPVGVLVFLLNVPLLSIGWISLGWKSVFLTILATTASSFSIEFVRQWLPVYCGDPLLAAVSGGVLMGLGLAILYVRGVSMGGSDIISTLIHLRFPFIPIGKALLIFNSLVVFSSYFVYGNIESALYSAIGVFVSSKTIDSVLVGSDSGNMLYVVSDKAFTIAEEVHRLVGRGGTVLRGIGTAKGQNRNMLIVVARRHEFSKIKGIVKRIDSSSFVVVADVREVLGNGFKAIDST